MANKNILVLKNDRAGDLISSVRLISKLISQNKKLDIYLSEFNYDFKFLIPNCNHKKIGFNLNFIDKIKIFFDIFNNKYDEIFILAPKNYYFFLPVLFKKIKFYAIVINGKKRNRPIFFLRRYLYKTSIRYRNKINKHNIIQSNLSLIDDNNNLDSVQFKLEKINTDYFKHISKNYIYFQFKRKFFKDLNWGTKEFEKIINFFESKYEKVVFSADIEKSEYDLYFEKNYSFINFENKASYVEKNNKKTLYLKKVDPINLFHIIKNANKVIGPHGLITQISSLLNKKSVNLFNFEIKDIKDYHHQKISFSEWYSNMGIKFIFLNEDVKKSLKKIAKFV